MTTIAMMTAINMSGHWEPVATTIAPERMTPILATTSLAEKIYDARKFTSPFLCLAINLKHDRIGQQQPSERLTLLIVGRFKFTSAAHGPPFPVLLISRLLSTVINSFFVCDPTKRRNSSPLITISNVG